MFRINSVMISGKIHQDPVFITKGDSLFYTFVLNCHYTQTDPDRWLLINVAGFVGKHHQIDKHNQGDKVLVSGRICYRDGGLAIMATKLHFDEEVEVR